MEKWTLYLGLNDKDSKVQKISTLEAYKVVSNLIATKEDTGRASGVGRIVAKFQIK